MDEEKKVIITETETRNKIIQKLRNRKIDCLIKDNFREDIGNENFIMDIRSAYYYGNWSNEERNYNKVNIQISTREYPHTRRRLNNFDVNKGDYKELAEKVKFIIQEDIKKKQEQQLKENNEKKNLDILKEKLQGLGARKEHYGDNYKIRNKYFEMTFYAFDDRISVDIKEPKDMTIDQAIELIKKLQ